MRKKKRKNVTKEKKRKKRSGLLRHPVLQAFGISAALSGYFFPLEFLRCTAAASSSSQVKDASASLHFVTMEKLINVALSTSIYSSTAEANPAPWGDLNHQFRQSSSAADRLVEYHSTEWLHQLNLILSTEQTLVIWNSEIWVMLTNY